MSGEFLGMKGEYTQTLAGLPTPQGLAIVS